MPAWLHRDHCSRDRISRGRNHAQRSFVRTEDPRFEPVTERELPELVYSVDVLSVPELISSEDELDVNRFGVIVTKGFRRGLLLPNLDGVDTVREQVDIAKQKAGIRKDETVETSAV
jgi:AMMECR1 domain-containing protein